MNKSNKMMMSLFIALIIFAAILFVINKNDSSEQNKTAPESVQNEIDSSMSDEEIDKSDAIIAKAFEKKKSDISVEGQGTVEKLLADDKEGSEHQKFIIKLSSGQTLMVAHNISIADKIEDLKEGDLIQFSGEYVWNDEGGLIHWTHDDPDGSHSGGWLIHNGKKYK